MSVQHLDIAVCCYTPDADDLVMQYETSVLPDKGVQVAPDGINYIADVKWSGPGRTKIF